MSARECLHCGENEAVVIAVRRKDGYTLGCGVESNTEAGYDYEELSERHRWADWRDSDLARFGVKPEAFEKHRRTQDFAWGIACEDTVRGHTPAEKDDAEFGMKKGQCWACGKMPADTTGSAEQ